MIDAFIDLEGEEITIGANTEQLIRMIDGAAECLQDRGFDTEELRAGIGNVARQYIQQKAEREKLFADLEEQMAKLEEAKEEMTQICLSVGQALFGTEQERHG